jgi:outer membrane protein with beta-barrel domain
MRRRTPPLILVGLVCVAAWPTAAAAQDNAVGVSVGYSFLANDDLAMNEKSLPWGFLFDAALRLNDWISVAGDLDGHFRRGIEPSASLDRVVPPLPTEDFQAFSFNRPETGFCSPRIEDCKVHIQTISGVAGPRFHVPAGRARPFVHVMAGATRSLRQITFFSHTSTNFTIQPGAGVDLDLTPITALRIQGDYRRVFFPVPDQTDPGSSLVSKDGADYQDVIFTVGVVFKLGQRQ